MVAMFVENLTSRTVFFIVIPKSTRSLVQVPGQMYLFLLGVYVCVVLSNVETDNQSLCARFFSYLEEQTLGGKRADCEYVVSVLQIRLLLVTLGPGRYYCSCVAFFFLYFSSLLCDFGGVKYSFSCDSNLVSITSNLCKSSQIT